MMKTFTNDTLTRANPYEIPPANKSIDSVITNKIMAKKIYIISKYAHNGDMYTKRFAVIAILVGLAGIVAELTQIITYDNFISNEWSYPESKWNYLSFFTTLTNLTIDFWLIFIALSVFTKSQRVFNALTAPAVMGALVVYIGTVSIVYCTLLFWFIGPFSAALWWGNLIDMWHHLLVPLFVALTWWLSPKPRALPLKMLGLWIIFPLIYFAVVEIRGLLTGWYPYPFLRPSWIMFPIGVSATIACILLLSWAVITINNRHTKRP